MDAVVSPVNVEGKAIKASDWLTSHRMVTSLACDPTLEGDYIVGADYIDGSWFCGKDVPATTSTDVRRSNSVMQNWRTRLCPIVGCCLTNPAMPIGS